MRKSRGEQSRVYRGLDNAMKKMNDKNGCSVIAMSIAFGISYEDAYKELEFVGRIHGRGVSQFQLELVAKRLAYQVNGETWLVSKEKIVHLKEMMGVTPTLNNIVSVLPKGKKYIVSTRDHVVTVKGGRVHDWAEGRKLQVQNIIEVKI